MLSPRRIRRFFRSFDFGPDGFGLDGLFDFDERSDDWLDEPYVCALPRLDCPFVDFADAPDPDDTAFRLLAISEHCLNCEELFILAVFKDGNYIGGIVFSYRRTERKCPAGELPFRLVACCDDCCETLSEAELDKNGSHLLRLPFDLFFSFVNDDDPPIR